MEKVRKVTITQKDIENIKESTFSFSTTILNDNHFIDFDIRAFIKDINIAKNSYIDMRFYVGTSHGRYCCKTFKENLLILKKKYNWKELMINPDYYFEKSRKGIFYIKCSGKYYLSHEGNNRSIIAKHLFAYLGVKPWLYGIDIVEAYLDQEAIKIFTMAKSLIKKLFHDQWIIKPYNKDLGQTGSLYENKKACRTYFILYSKKNYTSEFLKNKPILRSYKHERLIGFIFDEKNIHILKNWILFKNTSKKFKSLSPELVFDKLLKKELTALFTYGFKITRQTNFGWMFFKRQRYIERNSYMYLEDRKTSKLDFALAILFDKLKKLSRN